MLGLDHHGQTHKSARPAFESISENHSFFGGQDYGRCSINLLGLCKEDRDVWKYLYTELFIVDYVRQELLDIFPRLCYTVNWAPVETNGRVHKSTQR